MLTKGPSIHPVPWYGSDRNPSLKDPTGALTFCHASQLSPQHLFHTFAIVINLKASIHPHIIPYFKVGDHYRPRAIHDLSGPPICNVMREIGIMGETALPTVDMLGFSGWSCRLELRHRCQHLEASLLGPIEALFSSLTQQLSAASPSPFPSASAACP